MKTNLAAVIHFVLLAFIRFFLCFIWFLGVLCFYVCDIGRAACDKLDDDDDDDDDDAR